uniref:Allatostatin c n=1 Tax=Deroceras reticulatum TaxID=145610 RepID=A0A1X9WEB6_DERRE|nr:allatostatin c [Deroceras reticulatum]
MVKVSEMMRMSPVVACLMVVVVVMVVDPVRAGEGGVYRPEFASHEEVRMPSRETQSSTGLGTIVNKDDVKRELTRQLLILQEAEENILSKISQFEAERRSLSNRQRRTYSSMCMFNVVACYRK